MMTPPPTTSLPSFSKTLRRNCVPICTVATFLIALFSPPLALVGQSFGAPEYFSLMVLGLIAAVVALAQLSEANVPLSELLAPFRRYAASGEINTEVADPHSTIERIAESLKAGTQDRLDGLTVEFEDWWCNVRPSNTEPLLRLNAEAKTDELLQEKTAMVLELIRGGERS